MLVHIHIPKNAGTTLNSILKREFRGHYYDFHTDRNGRFLTDSEFCDLVIEISQDSLCLSGHDIRPLDFETSQKFNLKYLTFVRHPVDRAISLYFFEKKRTSTDHVSHLSFQQYVEQRSTHDNAISNWQVYNLAREATFEAAKTQLDSFLAVGLVGEFDKSLILLKHSLQNSGIDKFNTAYVSKNVTASKSLSSNSIDKATLNKLEELNSEDLQLWLYAKQRVEQEWKNCSNRLFDLKVHQTTSKVYARYVELKPKIREIFKGS